jgi:NAD(P)-dependent dehydrogenase (short-subunit alcohol dehydrogenase family)
VSFEFLKIILTNNYYRNGGFNIAKRALPLLLQAKDSIPHPPTLIFTGATASIKGSANFAAFASSKFALRALAQSLAREFGPKGIHVSHAIIDGVIDIPRTKAWTFEHEDAKLSPDAVSLIDLFVSEMED